MKKIFFTVGPSQIYPTLVKHLNQAVKEDILSLSHRGTEFKKLFKETTENLKKLLNIPANYQVFFVSSALEAMERILQGCALKNSSHLITGSFGKIWETYANQLGKKVVNFEEAELICITQNDTSTGVWTDPKQIKKFESDHPDKLIAVDVVSSIPYVSLDYKYIDIAFFSVQKGFGLPAGLGVMIISPKALEKTGKLLQKGVGIGSYHSLRNLSDKAKDFQTPETPNVLNIYLLNQVIKDMLKTGLKKIRQDTDKKAKILYEFFDNHKKYQPFIKDSNLRSPTTIVVDVKGESEKLRRKLIRAGFIIGAGYGDNKLNHIRIANFPTHQLKDILKMLKYF